MGNNFSHEFFLETDNPQFQNVGIMKILYMHALPFSMPRMAMSPFLFAVPFIKLIVMILCLPTMVLAEGTNAWDPTPILSQMRWKLDEQDYDSGESQNPQIWLSASPEVLKKQVAESQELRTRPGSTLQGTVAYLLSKNDEKSRQTAISMLREQIALTPPGDLDEIISDHGVEYIGVLTPHESGNVKFEVTGPNPQRMRVLNARDLAAEYALLYLATGDRQMAEKSKDILLRFAKVMPTWPRYDRDNKARLQSDESAFHEGGPNGLWSEWFPLDLAHSLPLLRAYDILRPLLSPEEKASVEAAFVHHKDFIDRFEGGWPWKNYNNLTPIHLVFLFRFAQVLEKPEWVHQMVSYWDEMLYYVYTPDGFWSELTPDYDQGVTTRLMGTLPKITKGYSDPANYHDATTGKRFDNLDLNKLAETRFKQMRRGFGVLAMPDGKIVVLNDAWPGTGTRTLEADSPVKPGAPGLLGAAGLAKLGSKGMSAFLKFSGTRGHEHQDALNLIWFAAGREVFGETGYQALPGSDSSRWWHTIAASHNTVAVNEMSHFQNELPQFQIKGPQVPNPGTDGMYHSNPPISPNPSEKVVAALPKAARYRNQGRLLIWDATSPEAQAMEAEQQNAYPGLTSLFRRTIVMVPLETGEGYLIDIFRIKGGKTHDYFLRGGLDWPYEMKFDVKLEDVNKTLYKYINITKEAQITPPLLAKILFENGPSITSHLADAFGSPAKLDLFVGDAPAIRRLGHATFSILRRSAINPEEPMESCFVWVHEASAGDPKIKGVHATSNGMNIAVTVQMENRTDLVLSGDSDNSTFAQEGLDFTGKLAFVSKEGSDWKQAKVFSGGDLTHKGIKGKDSLLAAGKPVLTGEVLQTASVDQGGTDNSMTIHLDKVPGDTLPQLAHIDFGDIIRLSIPIEKFIPGEDNTAKVILAHSPGFRLQDGRSIMTHYPGWAIKEKTTVRLE